MTMTMIRMKPVLALAICAAAFCCQPARGQQGPKDAGTPKTDTLPREVKVTIQLGKDSTLAAPIP